MTVPPDIIVQVDAQVVPINIFALNNTWTGANTWNTLQTFSGGISATSQLPGLSANVEATGTPGLDGAQWFIYNNIALGNSRDSAPTLRLDRVSTGTGGNGGVVPTLWVNTTTSSGNSYFEWAGLFQMFNQSTTAAENVALAAQNKRALGATSPTFGANIAALDLNSTANPTTGLVGLEIDCGTDVSINGGTDIHSNRVILNIVGAGASGTHVGHGLRLSMVTGVTIDRGITYQGAGAYTVGLDFADATFNTAAVFLAATNRIVFDGSWSSGVPSANRWLSWASGILTYTTPNGSGLQLYDNGRLDINGANTGGSTNINLVNGGDASNASSFSVVKAAFNTTTQYIQMYMGGGGTPYGAISSSGSISINSASTLALQVSGVNKADYGATANTWGFHGSGGVVIDTATGLMLNAVSTNTGALNNINIQNNGTATNTGTIAMFSAQLGGLAASGFQFYVLGGSGASGLQGRLSTATGLTNGVNVTAAAGPITLNPATTLQFQSNSSGIGDYGLTTASTWTFAAAVVGTSTVQATGFKVGSNQIVGARATGWTVATGTPSRATFTTSGVTLATLAGVVMALEQDLITHGLIGT